MGVREERFLGRMFNDQEKHSQKAPDEQDIQPASQRQRHGGRGRAHRRLPIASRTRARDPRAPTCGHAQMLPMRRTLARLRPRRRRRAPLAWPGFRLLARRTGRRHDARGLPEVRCVCSIESGPCERVDVFHVSGRFWSTSACGEKRTPARPAWTSFPS